MKNETSDPQLIRPRASPELSRASARLGPGATNPAQMDQPPSWLPIPCYPGDSINGIGPEKSAYLLQTCTRSVPARRCLPQVHVWRMVVILVPVVLSRAQKRTCSLSNPTSWNPTCTVVPLAVITVAFHPDEGVADITLSVVVVS